MELFDFAASIGAQIDFDGTWHPEYARVRVALRRPGTGSLGGVAIVRDKLVVGEDKRDADVALASLAMQLSGCRVSFGLKSFDAPALTHTQGYRG